MANGISDKTQKRRDEVYNWTDSAAVQKARADVDNYAPFQSQWKDTSNNLLQEYVNRDKFSYNPNQDRSFAQYKDMYTRNGQMAMRDTSAQATALTGGYGSSYATTAAAQIYNKYMQELNDKIPEFEQAAYDRYMNEGNDLLNRYQASNQQYQQDYSDWLNEYNRRYGRYTDEKGFDQNDRQIKAGITSDDYSTENSDYWRQAELDNDNYWKQAQMDEERRQFNEKMDEDKRQFDQTMEYNRLYIGNGDGSVTPEKTDKTEKIIKFISSNPVGFTTAEGAGIGAPLSQAEQNEKIAAYIENQLDSGNITAKEAAYLFEYYKLGE